MHEAFLAESLSLYPKVSPIQRITKLIIIAFFGAIMFVTRVFVPPPIDKMLIVVDAVLLAVSALFLKTGGATAVATVGGILAGLWLPTFLPFSLIFAIIYGAIVDFLFIALRIKATRTGVPQNRLIATMALSTLAIAAMSYYVFSYYPNVNYVTSLSLAFIPRNDLLNMLVIFMGTITGVVAGYAASYLWNKYLKNIAQ